MPPTCMKPLTNTLPMRNILTLVLITLSFSLNAQSAFFVGIGQDTGEVREYLESRTYLRTLTEDSINLWTGNVFANQEIKYRFHEGTLYAIEDIRVFDDKEKAEAIAETCISYLKLLDFDSKQLESVNSTEHYVAVTHDKVVEFIRIQERGSDNISCTLKVTSRRYGPRMKTESFVASVNGM